MRDPVPDAATNGRRIAYHSLLNLIGTGSPLLVAVVAIPLLIDGLGTERFGILTLVWVAVGYLSLLDLGIGRALTKLVAERVGRAEEAEIPSLIGTALAIMVVAGGAGALVVAALAPWLARTVLSVPTALVEETSSSFQLLAACLPIVTLTSALRGVLEAYHRFGLVNAVRLPMGIFTFAGPLLVLPFSNSLLAVVAVLLTGRLVAVVVHGWLVCRCFLEPRRLLGFDWRAVMPLLRFGGWMTVSNTVSPLMVYMDRFLIGALISASAVAYYATPYEVVTKLWLVPGAILSVLFPAFSAGLRADSRAEMASLFGRSVVMILAVIAPITLLIVTFGEAGLTIWVGEEFARNSTIVLQWLAVGVLINCVAQVPFTLLQGAGRPDLTARLQLIELPYYLVALWWLTVHYGIVGTAVAWVVRVAVDAVLLFYLCLEQLPDLAVWIRRIAAVMVVILLLVPGGIVLPSLALKLAFATGVLAAAALLGWAALRPTSLAATAVPRLQEGP